MVEYKNYFNKTPADSPRIWLTVSKPRQVMKVVMNAFCRNVTFWKGVVGFSPRLGTAGSRSERKSISVTISFYSLHNHFQLFQSLTIRNIQSKCDQIRSLCLCYSRLIETGYHLLTYRYKVRPDHNTSTQIRVTSQSCSYFSSIF